MRLLGLCLLFLAIFPTSKSWSFILQNPAGYHELLLGKASAAISSADFTLNLYQKSTNSHFIQAPIDIDPRFYEALTAHHNQSETTANTHNLCSLYPKNPDKFR